mgnify:CR=1 FL=1
MVYTDEDQDHGVVTELRGLFSFSMKDWAVRDFYLPYEKNDTVKIWRLEE